MTAGVLNICGRFFFFFSSRRRHTRFKCDWSSDVCSSDLYKSYLLNAHESKPLVEAVRMRVVILRVEHNSQHFCFFKEIYRLAHQTRANALTAHRGMDCNPHEVTKFALQGIKLVSHYFPVQFRHHKIGMRRGDIFERARIIAPEILEASLLDSKQRGDVTSLNRTHLYLCIAFCGNTVVELVVGVQQPIWHKFARYEYVS